MISLKDLQYDTEDGRFWSDKKLYHLIFIAPH